MQVIDISSAFFHISWLKKKIILVEYIVLAATYVKMLYYSKISTSEGIDVNKSNKSKECMICHYWYFKDIDYKFEPYICNGCHDISMMAYELENIAILNIKGIDYRCVIWNLIRNDAINKLNNSKLVDKGSL